MATTPDPGRFYGDLAPWWPLISPVEDYAEEAAEFADLLASAAIGVRDVLELGSGGGSNAAHLTSRFAMTLVDLSQPMLEVSRRRNPQCTHQQGDMRTVRLGRDFDAVFVHDAVDYMTSEADLRRAMDTAFIHCRPGGLALFVPDDIRGDFEPARTAAAATPRTAAARATWSGAGTPTPPTRGRDRVRVPAPRRRRLGAGRPRDAPDRPLRPRRPGCGSSPTQGSRPSRFASAPPTGGGRGSSFSAGGRSTGRPALRRDPRDTGGTEPPPGGAQPGHDGR